MDTKTLLIGGGVLAIIIYAIYKMQPQTVTVPTLVPVGNVNDGPDEDKTVYEQAKSSAFSELTDLAQSTISSKTLLEQSKIEATSAFDLESIRSSAQEKSEMLSSTTNLKLAEIGTNAQIQIAGFNNETMRALQQDLIAGNVKLLEEEGRQRADEITRQVSAVQSTAAQYKNNSLERQGTVLNALATMFGQSKPYNYVEAFGGTRGPSIFSQLLAAGTQLAKGFI